MDAGGRGPGCLAGIRGCGTGLRLEDSQTQENLFMPMKTTDAFRKDGLHRCGHCGRVLPAESFYVNSRTQRPDAYCKDCRRETNRCARKKMRPKAGAERRVSIPLVADRQVRLGLILQALGRVRERYLHKRAREKEADLRAGG